MAPQMELVVQVAKAAQRYRDSVGEEVQKLSLDFLIDTLVASQHAGRLIHFVFSVQCDRRTQAAA